MDIPNAFSHEVSTEEIWVVYCPSEPGLSRHYTSQPEAVRALIRSGLAKQEAVWYLCHVENEMRIVKMDLPPGPGAPS